MSTLSGPQKAAAVFGVIAGISLAALMVVFFAFGVTDFLKGGSSPKVIRESRKRAQKTRKILITLLIITVVCGVLALILLGVHQFKN